MALGNSNSSAQSRGKNKAVVVKRRKEVVAAKDYQKRGVAFVIARSIRRKGISPTHFMDEAILEGIDTLDDTLAKMIDIELDNRFN